MTTAINRDIKLSGGIVYRNSNNGTASGRWLAIHPRHRSTNSGIRLRVSRAATGARSVRGAETYGQQSRVLLETGNARHIYSSPVSIHSKAALAGHLGCGWSARLSVPAQDSIRPCMYAYLRARGRVCMCMRVYVCVYRTDRKRTY